MQCEKLCAMQLPATSPGLSRSQARPIGRCRPALVVVLLATLAGFFFSAQIYYTSASLQHPVIWLQALYWGFGDWYEWALLSPLIFWLCRRFPFDRGSWRKGFAVHLACGVAVPATHAMLCALAAVLQGAVTGPPASFAES